MEIPVRQIDVGIAYCLQKSLQLLDDARLIVNNGGNLTHAVGLYLYALEEFGKALLLERARENPASGNICEVPKWVFGRDRRIRNAHDRKIAQALLELPNICREVDRNVFIETNPRLETTSINNDYFTVSIGGGQIGRFTETIDVDFGVRIGCFYIDWLQDKGRWKMEPPIDRTILLKAIQSATAIVQEHMQ